MSIASKADLLAHRGPEAMTEIFTSPGTELTVSIRGIVRSYARASIYREIEDLAALSHILVDGERVPVTEDDIVAACWAEACVSSPKLTAMEWLMVGGQDADLLAQIGERCLICSRLMSDAKAANGLRAASQEAEVTRDPFDSSPSGSV